MLKLSLVCMAWCAWPWFPDYFFCYFYRSALKRSLHFFELAYTKKGIATKVCVNYSTGGMTMPGRSWSGGSDYRYSHNGHEKENEIFNGAQSAEYWMYDSRTLRRWEMDPVTYEYQSPYACFNNNPVFYADPLGLEGEGDPDLKKNNTITPKQPKNNVPTSSNQPPASDPKSEIITLAQKPISSIPSNGTTPEQQLRTPQTPESTISQRQPTAWDRFNAVASTMARGNMFGPAMAYNAINDSYITYNWMINRQAYDLQGIQVGYNRAVSTSFITSVSMALGPLAGEINGIRMGFGVMNPKEIYFMQNSCSNTTGDYTVLGNAEALRLGELNPTVLRMNVWEDVTGKVWTLDHRRLTAFRLSGLEEAPIQWGAKINMKKMTTTNGGTSIILKLGLGKTITVK